MPNAYTAGSSQRAFCLIFIFQTDASRWTPVTIMTTPIFDFPVVELGWYGILSVISLLCFASLTYEVKGGLDACMKAGAEDAWKAVWTTYNVNFVAMVVANMAFIVACVGICISAGSDWRAPFAVSILACGAYWFYTRACEKKLILFLQAAGISRQRHQIKSLREIFKAL